MGANYNNLTKDQKRIVDLACLKATRCEKIKHDLRYLKFATDFINKHGTPPQEGEKGE